ncbi:MAG: glycosyltransferase family 4 protein, partial [Thermodesulfobacteriota bacterium]
IAGNQFLREEALKHTWEETVFVVPTVVDTDKYVMKDYGRPGNTVVLGWIGSRSTIWYLQNLVSVLETLCRIYSQLTMKVVSDAFPDCAALPIIKKRWNAAEEMSDLRSFDIGLVPLTDDVWSRGKCGLKAVQYLAVGIPVVCSPVGANREIIEDGVNGYWASTEAEWVEKISRLVEDPALRREMGSRGRKRVEEGFSLELASREVFTLFQRLCR